MSTEKKRSLPQHRRYFAMIKAAYDQWPERHKFKPDSAEHLRKWLQCKARHRTVVEVETDQFDERVMAIIQAAVTAAMKATGGYAWVGVTHSGAAVLASKSIAIEELPHPAFCALNEAVEDIIRAETGLEPEQLLTERAA